ncbi:pur operon repressor [Aminipila luticellarii]|uniref:Pur operon repressor n=1 Tax=Aminipila luticellarii TaxID=2507160 RepID=A0A410PUB4_9FIRM|nr:pur operon repressor [Aminipila luticellarii]QAT42515.1 pur operon repressor [Aminipila luticellarii]
MKRAERVAAIIKILSDTPNKLYSLNYFCTLFGAAKSSISEDLLTAKQTLQSVNLGIIQTISGSGGGVKYIPYISDENCRLLQEELCEKLRDGSRILGGGFLYTSDVMFDANIARQVATVFARKFQDYKAEYIATIETKGIPIATMTAHMLHLPMIIIRRESKISEGSTLSINYFSGSSDRVQKMSVSKRAVVPGSKVLIIDDFMRAGGSVKGIKDILAEFEVEIVGTGIVIASTEPEKKKIQDYCTLLYLGKVDENTKEIEVYSNCQIF